MCGVDSASCGNWSAPELMEDPECREWEPYVSISYWNKVLWVVRVAERRRDM